MKNKHLTIEHPHHGTRKISIEEALKITTKSRRTVDRWCEGSQEIDSDSYKLLQVYTFGLMPSLSPDWRRLYVQGDTIYSTEQVRFKLSADNLQHVWMTYQMNRELKRLNEVLRGEKAKPRHTAELISFADYRFDLSQKDETA